MKGITLRVVARWIHFLCVIPIVGYIYSPFEVLPSYAHPTRYVFFPVMVVTGLWMWKGHLLLRRVSA
jgi:thiosulfate reductase cytochrome b subunit